MADELRRKPYFYDAQLKRYLLQIMSCFLGYRVRTGTLRNGEAMFRDVPVIYGDMSRTAAYILSTQGDQANTTNYLPVMALYLTGMDMSNESRKAPAHTERFRYRERKRDGSGNLTSQETNEKIVERHMPVPYDISVDLSIWSSNNDEGFQLLEQIMTVFNPQVELQLSNSPADWTFMTSLFLEGGVNMEKAIPDESTDPLYVNTLTFRTLIWLSPPAKKYDSQAIYHVNVDLHDLEKAIDFDESVPLDDIIIQATAEEIEDFEGG